MVPGPLVMLPKVPKELAVYAEGTYSLGWSLGHEG